MEQRAFIVIRKYRPEDLRSLASLYARSIRSVGRAYYSEKQISVWSGFSDDLQRFATWIDQSSVYVATEEQRQCIGFGGLESRGRISSLFVAPEYQRMGIGAELVERLLEEARTRKLDLVTTEASEFSRPLFEKYGFATREIEHTELNDVAFTRHVMELRLQ